MFAFALWDGSRNRLFCARDRFGMKPFYFSRVDDQFLFGSEIKALMQGPGVTTRPNQKMIHDFLVLNLQDHTDETFFHGIQQLQPGHFLVISPEGVFNEQWWDLPLAGQGPQLHDQDAVQKFYDLFHDAVRVHLRSDVPIGSCLSGGLDSSSIVCTAHALRVNAGATKEEGEGGHRGFKTFSSCFENPVFDERRFLKTVVAQTQAQSVEVFPEPRRLFDALPRILWFQDEPIGSTSFLAQWSVMEAVAQHGVKVVLDGQGGDELLCGYPGYWGSYLGDLLKTYSIVSVLRAGRAYLGRHNHIHPTLWANLARALLPPGIIRSCRFGLKGHRFWVNREFASQFSERHALLDYGQQYPTSLANHLAAYIKTHSLPALLHHEDRNSMAFSIEARLPFLDARLVEFLLSLSADQKLHNGQSKFILRQAMTTILPASVKNRTDKMGFVTPQDEWLRQDLRPHLEEIFHSSSFTGREYWKASHVQSVYRDYCHGGRSLGGSLWRCLNVELWHQQFFH
jgi:asparagine synthase (glutamine-hydrolysing)